MVATNRHVAKLVARRPADGEGVFLRDPASRGCATATNSTSKRRSDSLARPKRRRSRSPKSLYLADDSSPDVALLRITGDRTARSAPPLADDDAEVGERVGHHRLSRVRPRNNADDQASTSSDLFDVKRFAPGYGHAGADGVGLAATRLHEPGGNSGSPLIGWRTGEVVGPALRRRVRGGEQRRRRRHAARADRGRPAVLTAGFIASAQAHRRRGGGRRDARRRRSSRVGRATTRCSWVTVSRLRGRDLPGAARPTSPGRVDEAEGSRSNCGTPTSA